VDLVQRQRHGVILARGVSRRGSKKGNGKKDGAMHGELPNRAAATLGVRRKRSLKIGGLLIVIARKTTP
jgi:hypothetical protein